MIVNTAYSISSALVVYRAQNKCCITINYTNVIVKISNKLI